MSLPPDNRKLLARIANCTGEDSRDLRQAADEVMKDGRQVRLLDMRCDDASSRGSPKELIGELNRHWDGYAALEDKWMTYVLVEWSVRAVIRDDDLAWLLDVQDLIKIAIGIEKRHVSADTEKSWLCLYQLLESKRLKMEKRQGPPKSKIEKCAMEIIGEGVIEIENIATLLSVSVHRAREVLNVLEDSGAVKKHGALYMKACVFCEPSSSV